MAEARRSGAAVKRASARSSPPSISVTTPTRCAPTPSPGARTQRVVEQVRDDGLEISRRGDLGQRGGEANRDAIRPVQTLGGLDRACDQIGERSGGTRPARRASL